MKKEYDIIIIGAGVVGCSIARELSKYQVDTLLIEKECDVAMGTSGSNSGVAHAGFYVKPGTLKAELNIKGHRVMPKLCQELDVPYQEVGKLVVAKNEDETEYLYKLKEVGEVNGTKELNVIDRERIKELEPNIEGVNALHSPTSAILDPFLLTIGLAENAVRNEVRILLDTEVLGIEVNDFFTVKTGRGKFRTEYVVNSAGLFSDRIARMVGITRYRIYPCRGEYHILDKNRRNLINGMIYPVPPKDLGGLGVHLTPTTDENILIGPSAEYIEEVNVANTVGVMDNLFREAEELLPKVSRKDIIRSFAGIRTKLIQEGSTEPKDFVIEDAMVNNFINLIGIESPGLTAAPAIAEKVVELIKKGRELDINQGFKPERKSPVRFNKLTPQEKTELIKRNPNYGEIVCRCETVTKQEVIDALNNPLGAGSIYSVRRRTKATCGRCQGGFCIPKIVEVINEVSHPSIEDLTLKGKGSELFIGRTRE
ncbi:MAG: NAD(P)/FAD-dependent oxidoreductase [Candidatus Altiarchaeota archaeon]|nr:NAD(P)/FAD-dependent oxidoreductase [Candidatus Altiarchaeota archaeon]